MLTAVVIAIFGLLFIWFSLWASNIGRIEWIIHVALVLALVLVIGLIISVLGLYAIIIICLIIAVFAIFKDRHRKKYW